MLACHECEREKGGRALAVPVDLLDVDVGAPDVGGGALEAAELRIVLPCHDLVAPVRAEAVKVPDEGSDELYGWP